MHELLVYLDGDSTLPIQVYRATMLNPKVGDRILSADRMPDLEVTKRVDVQSHGRLCIVVHVKRVVSNG